MQIAYARVYAGQGELLKKIGAARGNLPEYSREEYMNAEAICQAVAPSQLQVDKAALLADAKPLSSTYASLVKPFAPAVSNKVEPAAATAICSIPDVTYRVNDWAETWRKKDADSHLKLYADKFVPEPPTAKSEWIAQRQQSLSTNSKIGLNMENLLVSCDGDKAVAKFKQKYTLTTFKMKKDGSTSCEVCNMKRVPIITYSSKNDKELHYERINNNWLIVRELTSK